MWKKRANCAPLIIDPGSYPCAIWKPPKRSIRLPADCTAANTMNTRKPRMAPVMISCASAPKKAGVIERDVAG
jgi:hypothetical protein